MLILVYGVQLILPSALLKALRADSWRSYANTRKTREATATLFSCSNTQSLTKHETSFRHWPLGTQEAQGITFPNSPTFTP